MTVSVIVPFYKAEEWWQQCLHSIRSQDYEDVELIIEYDDDGTGAAATRNRGLDKATGEYVMFCDADDYLEPGAIGKMVNAIEGVDMVAGSFRKFGDFEQIVSHETSELTIQQVAEYAMKNLQDPRRHQMLSGCWAKLYRRRLIFFPFPLLTTAEDMAFNYTYLASDGIQSIRFISDVVYHNRKRQGSLSTTFNANDKHGLFGYLRALRYVREFLIANGMRKTEDAIDNAKVYHSMLYAQRIGNDALRKVFP